MLLDLKLGHVSIGGKSHKWSNAGKQKPGVTSSMHSHLHRKKKNKSTKNYLGLKLWNYDFLSQNTSNTLRSAFHSFWCKILAHISYLYWMQHNRLTGYQAITVRKKQIYPKHTFKRVRWCCKFPLPVLGVCPNLL